MATSRAGTARQVKSRGSKSCSGVLRLGGAPIRTAEPCYKSRRRPIVLGLRSVGHLSGNLDERLLLPADGNRCVACHAQLVAREASIEKVLQCM